MHKLWCLIILVCSVSTLISQPGSDMRASREFTTTACMFEIGLCNPPPPSASGGGPACPVAAQVHANNNGLGNGGMHQSCNHD